jgi:hypothetical protein
VAFRSALGVALVLAAVIVAGCAAPGPEAAPASAAAAEAFRTAPPDTPAPAPALRPCLGPWQGSGSMDSYTVVAVDGGNNVPPVQVTEPGVRVAVWLNATPRHEGLGSLTPTDHGVSPLDDRSVRFDLTGDPAYGEADVPPGGYEFGFNPDTGPGIDHVEWTVSIREVPRLGAPQCELQAA